jgi:hypothetical protein
MDESLQRKFALTGAAEALEIAIRETKSRIEEYKRKAEQNQQDIFVAFDAADYVQPKIMIGDQNMSIFCELDANLAKQIILRRLLRSEYYASKLSEKMENLQLELDKVKEQLQRY